MVSIIDKIREENIEWYGKCVLQPGGPEWGEIFTEKLYSERTHFLFELLQNAEDACERKRKITGESNFEVYFKLLKEGLEFRHNGILFDEEDVRGICYIGKGTKDDEKDDVSQIGKFGIGFKSVYAYTASPRIYSGEYAFKIENLVLPYLTEKRIDIKDNETLFFLPFNHKKVPPEKAYQEISKKLRDLGSRTLLFLKNINKITWEINGEKGNYSRKTENAGDHHWVTLYQDDKEHEKWLKFQSRIHNDEQNRVIEVAYLVNEDDGKKRIVPSKDTKLVVYFPTEQETHLNFLIHGPYNTTATRENIVDNDAWNNFLIEQTGQLVASTITKVKSLGLLDVSFLNTLPIRTEEFSNENNLFKPIYNTVRQKLKSEEEVLPADDGSYVSANNALLARGEKLRGLLTGEQLRILFNKVKWLDKEITQDKTPLLREYLMYELEIPEIDPERFAKSIDENFIKQQADEWLSKFYEFLLGQRALWREEYYSQPEGILRSKPIIRLEDGRNVAPFDKDRKPLAYLPPSDEKTANSIKKSFPTVKIDSNSNAIKFLKELGLTEPDAVDAVLEYILPKYRPWKEDWIAENEEDLNHVDLKDNLRDVQWIAKALEKSKSHPRKDKLIETIQQTEFLYCRNMADGRKHYCSSEDVIYVGSAYTGNKDIETFFEGNEDIWLLDEMYKDVIDIKTLKLFGCKDKIEVSFREPGWDNNVKIVDYRGWHERGLDGFDPDCEIEGLEWALKNITIEKSKIIWKILKNHYKQISGIVEYATKQDYSNKEQEYQFSIMGRLLIENRWIYDNKGTPYSPSEILISEISDEYGNFPENEIIAKKLRFKASKIEEIKKDLPEDERELLDLLEEVKNYGLKDELENLIRKKKKSESEKTTKSPSEIASEIKKHLTNYSEEDVETDESDGPFPILTPDEEKEIQKTHGERIATILKNLKLKTQVKPMTDSKIESAIDTHQFLFAEYNGHCQICNVRLFLGSKERGKNGVEFITAHLIEKRNKKAYAEMEWNVLCLCPNHFALFKYGIKNLEGIWELAESVLKDEIAAEWVEERKGNYYIAKIKMMGENEKLEETELFYSQTHMRKIVALLGEAGDA